MHGSLEPEENVLKDMPKKPDGFACPYPRRKLNSKSNETTDSRRLSEGGRDLLA